MDAIIIKKLSLILTIILLFICSTSPSSLAQKAPETTVLAPEGLKEKEKAELERQYRFEYRQKAMLQTPYAPGEITEGVEILPVSEDEELYRYFGIATDLYNSGKPEEAIELLKYILYKRPDDKYVKNYLEKIMREMREKETGWKKTIQKDAETLKKKEINDCIQDGIAFYENKDYDAALLKFADALSLDPNNKTAKTYLDRLKEYYAKEARVEKIVTGWESGVLEEKESAAVKNKKIFDYYIKQAEENALKGNLGEAYKTCKVIFTLFKLPEKIKSKILSEIKEVGTKKDEKKEIDPGLKEEVRSLLEKSTEDLSKKENFERLILYKKAEKLLGEIDLGLSIQAIVEQEREQEKRLRSFVLGPGDVLQVSVRGHPELSGPVTVKPNGVILLPLTNELIRASNLTLDELNEQVKRIMEKYVKDVDVNVSITEYRSKIFYVVDESGAAPYLIPSPKFTLRDALFLADWGDNRALGRVMIIKPSKLHPVIKTVNAFDIIYKGNLLNNLPIDKGDVIYIPKTFVGKANGVITDTFAPIVSLGSGLAGPNTTMYNIRRLKGQSMKAIKGDYTYGGD